LPSRRQLGLCPPPIETCTRSEGLSNRATYTSTRPDSSEQYAIHLPSGEKRGSSSSNGVFIHAIAVAFACGGTMKMSVFIDHCCMKAMKGPSGDSE